ncbi:hypothetical protein F4777DRAFT_578632 [Nemania sp. FL0916]|nr:hypothetical protein F4777DRAFT_578632 [Nemania sp. FL0916]
MLPVRITTVAVALLGGLATALPAVVVSSDPTPTSNSTLVDEPVSIASAAAVETETNIVGSNSTVDGVVGSPTVTQEIKGRPPATPTPPAWISPPMNPALDTPPITPLLRAQRQEYEGNAQFNNIPERVMAGPSSRAQNLANGPGVRQLMIHGNSIFAQFQYAHEVYRSIMLDPQNVGPEHPGLAQNGEIWPRPLRQAGRIHNQANGGELNMNTDLILEFPYGEGNSYFGSDFTNVNGPEHSRRNVPSNTLLVFGYRRADLALERPLYIGLITREGYQITGRSNWHWCPVVNYDATAGPTENAFHHAWQGVNALFGLGVITYFLRDWLIDQPFVKHPRMPPGNGGVRRDYNDYNHTDPKPFEEIAQETFGDDWSGGLVMHEVVPEVAVAA